MMKKLNPIKKYSILRSILSLFKIKLLCLIISTPIFIIEKSKANVAELGNPIVNSESFEKEVKSQVNLLSTLHKIPIINKSQINDSEIILITKKLKKISEKLKSTNFSEVQELIDRGLRGSSYGIFPINQNEKGFSKILICPSKFIHESLQAKNKFLSYLNSDLDIARIYRILSLMKFFQAHKLSLPRYSPFRLQLEKNLNFHPENAVKNSEQNILNSEQKKEISKHLQKILKIQFALKDSDQSINSQCVTVYIDAQEKNSERIDNYLGVTKRKIGVQVKFIDKYGKGHNLYSSEYSLDADLSVCKRENNIYCKDQKYSIQCLYNILDQLKPGECQKTLKSIEEFDQQVFKQTHLKQYLIYSPNQDRYEEMYFGPIKTLKKFDVQK